ncbi:hypothetical protein BJF78_33465 [Pseudonocardia sp. CNS-139]|nr:hypothetical protein BJF78_33465 [Pseudonocardia sp. CNS-139]
MLAALPVLWVNHPSRLADAAYKPVQLALAHECGLRVPDTVVTSEPESVRRFADGGLTVAKVLGSNTLSEDGVRKLTLTEAGPTPLWAAVEWAFVEWTAAAGPVGGGSG